VFYFWWIYKNMMQPGHVENWFILLDLEGVGITNIPLNKLKTFVFAIQSNFRGRLLRVVAVNSNWLLRSVWTIVYPWFDDYVQKKIVICSDIDSEEFKSIKKQFFNSN